MIQTKKVKLDPLKPDDNCIRQAAEILKNGGLVIIPTETVYGIAANLANKEAIKRLYEIKKRPADKPFALLIAGKEEIEQYAANIPLSAYKLADKLWPGPLTVILEAKEHKGTIGLRLPDDQIARKVITAAGVPLACPSANISGKSAPTDFSQAITDLEGLVDFAIDAGKTRLGTESSVVDLTQNPPRIVREAAVKKIEIERILNTKIVLFVCTGNSCRSVMAKALLEKKLKEKKRNDIEVLSAGIMLLGGLGATEATRKILHKEGIDVSGHRSGVITKEMLKKSDLILTMEKAHEERILELAPEVKNRVFLLKEFAKIKDNNLEIQDPISRPEEFYQETFGIIKEAVARIAEVI